MTDTKKAPLLTIQKATSQARRHVDKLMPGVLATVESRLSHDLETDTPLVITTVTFPANMAATSKTALSLALATLAGNVKQTDADSSIRIVRER